MIRSIKKFFHSLLHLIWSIFISGLLTILPLTLTVALLSVSFKLLTSWLEPFAYLTPHFLQRIPHGEVILFVASVFLIGFILNIFLVRSIVHFLEETIGNLPLIRPIYMGIKQLVGAFSTQDKGTFKHVVLVEFPRKGVYSIGFLTAEMPQAFMPETIHYCNVFIPTTPNPTSGFLIIVPRNEVTIIDITRQEAMALIISGGIIVPEKFAVKD